MTGADFRQRNCPCCGQTGSPAEMASIPAADLLPMAALQDAWEGINNKPFFAYHRCWQCGLLYNPSYFTDRQLAALYAQLAPNMDMVPPDQIRQTQQGYFEEIAREADLTGSYLEIGPDVGHLVEAAAQCGQFDRFWLFEPNRAVHTQLRKAATPFPVTLVEEMFDLAAVPLASVGLAVMIHVLDHLTDPLGMVRQIAARLRPGGLLAIVTHNEASLLRALIGKRWPPFCLQHPQLFSPATMQGLLQRAGLQDVKVTSSANVFPAGFLVQQAIQGIGLPASKLSLPSFPVKLRLGNILTLARAHDYAAAFSPECEQARA